MGRSEQRPKRRFRRREPALAAAVQGLPHRRRQRGEGGQMSSGPCRRESVLLRRARERPEPRDLTKRMSADMPLRRDTSHIQQCSAAPSPPARIAAALRVRLVDAEREVAVEQAAAQVADRPAFRLALEAMSRRVSAVESWCSPVAGSRRAHLGSFRSWPSTAAHRELPYPCLYGPNVKSTPKP